MSLFDYTGQLQTGSAFQGTLEAESQDHAEATLADMGVRVTSLRLAQRSGFVAPLSLDDVMFFNDQLAAITKAGVPLEQGLRQLAADTGSRKLKRLLSDLVDELSAGTPLEKALEKHRRRFPENYPGVVQAGLQTGDLSGTLYAVAAHLRLKSTMRRSLIELATYPLAILSLALVVISFLMRVVVPQIESMVREFIGDSTGPILGFGSPPPPTSLGAAGALFELARVWPVLETIAIVILVGGCLLFGAAYFPGGRSTREWLLRRIPGISQVYWSSVLARFTHTSALGALSGTPMPELIKAAGLSSGSDALARAASRVAVGLEKGKSLEEASADEPDVPALWTCVVQVTTQRGELPSSLAELARTYEARAEHWSRTMRTVLGPLLLFVVASMLGTVIVGIGLTFASMLQMLTG